MPTYRIHVKEVCWHIYEIDTDLTDHDDIESFFYDMDDQEEARIDTSCEEWIVDEIKEWPVDQIEEKGHA